MISSISVGGGRLGGSGEGSPRRKTPELQSEGLAQVSFVREELKVGLIQQHVPFCMPQEVQC